MKMTKSLPVFSRYLSSSLILGLTLCTLAASGQEKLAANTDTPRYKDPTLSISDRVADLLPRMTLEEKVYQLTGGWDSKIEVIDSTGTFTTETARQTLSAEWGPEVKFTPRQAAILRNGVQRYLHEKTRLGIPAMFLGEALHGYMEYGSTSFPQALGARSHVGSCSDKARLHGGWRRSRLSAARDRSFRRFSTWRAIRAGDGPKKGTAKIRI